MDYSTIHDHRYMLFDELRNKHYFAAIKQYITIDSVVLDLGAGLGIHAFMANTCGAKKVYLVDPAEILEVTKMIVENNGFSKNMQCILGEIEKVKVPEQVDVIVSVFTGNFLLTEDLLPSLFYARDKYLRSGGRMIPDRAKMIVVPVSSVDYYEEHIACWTTPTYDIDYNIVRQYAVNSLYYDSPTNRKEIFLSEPSNLHELDFMAANDAVCKSKIQIQITEDGIMHGCLGWFETRVGDEWISTSPVGEQMHWRQVFLPLNNPISVQNGDIISFELNRPEFGEWNWIVGFNGKYQRHSTFLSQPQKLKNLLKKTKDYKGSLSQEGKMAQDVLSLLNGITSIEDISSNLLEKYPQYFKKRLHADHFIIKIMEEYSE